MTVIPETSPVPAKVFAKGDPLFVQSQQIWTILTAFVMMKSFTNADGKRRRDLPDLISYKELAALMGRPGQQHVLGRQLGIIGIYCLMNGLPALNAVVVGEKHEEPGDGVIVGDGRSWREEMDKVHAQDWFELRPPTVGALRKVYDMRKEFWEA